MARRMRVGISSCLLGQKVRYDGGHKLDTVIVSGLGPYVEWQPICPEVESGLPVPREPMQLSGDPESPRLITVHTAQDFTERLTLWAEKRLREPDMQGLCGFVFKSGSPSCGLLGIEAGAGIFARSFMKMFPCVPTEEDARLRQTGIMEEFLRRISQVSR